MERRPSSSRGWSEMALARDLWRRGLGAVRRTPGLLVISLLLGAALWVFVTDTENPTRVDLFPASISVTTANVGRSLAVANTLSSVQVRVSAAEDRWERLTSNNFNAFVDLNGFDARSQQVPVSVDVQGIGGVRIVEIIPPVVLVNLETFVNKSVPVMSRLVGTVPLGYEVGATEPERESVEVSGPESLVALVREAVADVNVTGLTVALEQVVNLTPRGRGGGEIVGVRLDPPSLRVAVDVEQTTLTRTLPLHVTVSGEPAPGYRVVSVEVFPATILVQGTIEVLQGLEAITLPVIDITGEDGRVSKTTELSLDTGVRASGRTTATVVITIDAIEGAFLMTVVPRVIGVEDGMVARLDLTSVQVEIEGPLPALNTLAAADVRATVDAMGLDAGTAELSVEVELPPGVSLVAVQPPTLSVTLEVPR